MASPATLKRTFQVANLDNSKQPREEGLSILTPGSPTHAALRIKCENASNSGRSRDTSPLSSIDGSAKGEDVKDVNPVIAASLQAVGGPSKKRKLTLAEKEAKRIEKQYKDQQRAEDRARKEEEKARKEEEKRARDEQRRVKEEELKDEKRRKEEEKEKKQHVREEEKRKRDVERKAKDDEKAKKERSQLRLNSFFAKPSIPAVDSLDDQEGSKSRRNSIASQNGVEALDRSRSVSISLEKPIESDYQRTFPPFFIQSHTIVASTNRLDKCDGNAKHRIQELDGLLGYGKDTSLERAQNGKQTIKQIFGRPTAKRRKRKHRLLSVKNLLSQIAGSEHNPVDLITLTDSPLKARGPLDLLTTIPVKYLRFAEDVRPPYIGTYTKAPSPQSVFRLQRKPFIRALPAMNYDYDSEVEWEEPEEGEDLDSEDEEDVGEDEEGDDLGEFLDDEDAAATGTKRRHIMGNVQPICTGLHWEQHPSDKKRNEVPYGETSLDLNSFKIEVLLDKSKMPIDPHSTSYWQTRPLPLALPSVSAATRIMPPPPARTPDPKPKSKVPTHLFLTDTTLLKPYSAAPSVPNFVNPPAKPFPPEMLDDFKKAVDGSDLTKAGLVEILKKKFPQVTKDTIKETVMTVAKRTGRKEVDKRWILI